MTENVPHAWSDVLRAFGASSSHRESQCLIFKLKTVDNGC